MCIPNTQINVDYFRSCIMTLAFSSQYCPLKGKHLSHHYHHGSVFPDFELYGSTQLLFCISVLQLHFMSVRYIVFHFLFLDPSLYEYNQIYLIHFILYGLLGCFQFQAIINKAGKNIPMHVLQQMYALISFEYIPSRISGHRVQICVALVKLPSSFPWCLCQCTPTPVIYENN